MYERAKSTYMPKKRKALIGIDLQEYYLEEAKTNYKLKIDLYIDQFCKLSKRYDLVILTKTEHPSDHFSFDELGPHCIKSTKEAKINKKILDKIDNPIIVTRNSTKKDQESYSAFESETLRPKDPLDSILGREKIELLTIVGFGGKIDKYSNLDIIQTAYDSIAQGYETKIISYLVYPKLSLFDIDDLSEIGVTII